MLNLRSGVLEDFLAVVTEHPDRPAITSNGRVLTYAETAARVRDVARHLGERPGVVGVGAAHAPGTIVGLFGVWAAGGAYCPVDPAFPAPRRRAMLSAAGCRIVLRVTPGTVPVSVELTGADPADARAADELGDGLDDGLAYVLFTSGSTGEPKPVLTPHRAIAATVASLRELFGLTPDDRVLQFASLNWDTCFEEILPTLTSGAALVLHDDAYAGSFPRLLRMVDRERITVLDLPTAYWHELVNHLVCTGDRLPDCVRLMIIGGEAASPARLADWCGLGTDRVRLLNTYGCTETTLITHAIDLHGPFATGPPVANRVPIGRALPHVVEHITDEGELLIGGPALASGYRGLALATAARFITIPPTTHGRAVPDGERFFRTGDRVSRRADGSLVHEGRIDAELKVRGVRVDPAEVEAHIAGHPAVSAVAVVGLRVADHTVLAAYVVARAPSEPAGTEPVETEPVELGASIAEYLRSRVPAHLIPSRIRVVADLVYTASGKVDRHRIQEVLA